MRAPFAIMAAVEAIAARDPRHPALILRGGAIGYGDLVRQVRALAAQFARAGLAPGDTVGITLRDDLANILCALALLRLGCRQVALPARDPAPLREALVRRLSVSAVIGDETADALGSAALVVPDIEAARAAPLHEAPPPPGVGALVVGTSGTTGQPKLMEADEAMIVDRAALLHAHGGVVLQALGFDGNHGKRITLRSLVCGGTEVLAEGAPPEDFVALAQRFGIRRMHLQPQAAAAVLAQRRRGGPAWPPALRLFTTGTRIAQPFRLELQAVLGVGLHVQYGTTEAGMVSLAGPTDHAAHPDAVGRVFDGIDVSVVDEDGRELPPGTDGLLGFRSSGLVPGYIDDPAANARYFPAGWFRPGDIGRIDASRALFVTGRRDDLMTLGVIKIFPAEIEAVAEGFPGLRDCAAFPLPSPGLGEIPVLAVVPEAGFDAQRLLALCRERLGVRAPRKIVALDALPRNAAGKVLRRELVQLSGLAPD
ncbi:2-succinylbenzoate--CoA ligase [Roseomonas fluvialis]|uniref:2-succinylbenzoate--CoA ligase n=1 Tax=Roseomonas fluvialis TaxID=1750527 RepID=A0ABM7Y7M9_9PROT|nr:2-succinylbenzoate--CoA ligase [Roseomonas fluvialis]